MQFAVARRKGRAPNQKRGNCQCSENEYGWDVFNALVHRCENVSNPRQADGQGKKRRVEEDDEPDG